MTQFQTTHQQTRQQLEKLWQQPSPATRPSFKPWLKRLGQWLVASLTDSQQMRIWTQQTPTGQQWHAYDPASGHKHVCHSEAAMRSWLEARHRR